MTVELEQVAVLISADGNERWQFMNTTHFHRHSADVLWKLSRATDGLACGSVPMGNTGAMRMFQAKGDKLMLASIAETKTAITFAVEEKTIKV